MPSPPNFHEDKQRAAVLELAGKWVDSRPLDATIADIEEARTPGREVEAPRKAGCDGMASLSMTRTC